MEAAKTPVGDKILRPPRGDNPGNRSRWIRETANDLGIDFGDNIKLVYDADFNYWMPPAIEVPNDLNAPGARIQYETSLSERAKSIARLESQRTNLYSALWDSDKFIIKTKIIL
jgi:hypothetical protein